MSQSIELPPLDFGGHSPEVCECDLVGGGDGSCTIQPRYKDAYTQRCDQLLAALAEREQHLGEIERLKHIDRAYDALLEALNNTESGREHLDADKLIRVFIAEQERLRDELSLLRVTLESISVAVGHDLVSSRPLLATVMDKIRAASAGEGGWISVEQKLPPDKVKVLAYRHNVYALVYRPQLVDLDNMHQTSWQPLPAPPALPSKENTNG